MCNHLICSGRRFERFPEMCSDEPVGSHRRKATQDYLVVVVAPPALFVSCLHFLHFLHSTHKKRDVHSLFHLQVECCARPSLQLCHQNIPVSETTVGHRDSMSRPKVARSSTQRRSDQNIELTKITCVEAVRAQQNVKINCSKKCIAGQ